MSENRNIFGQISSLPEPDAENTNQCIDALRALRSDGISEISVKQAIIYMHRCINAAAAVSLEHRFLLFELLMEIDDIRSAMKEGRILLKQSELPISIEHHVRQTLSFRLLQLEKFADILEFALPLFARHPTADVVQTIYWTLWAKPALQIYRTTPPCSADEHYFCAREEWKASDSYDPNNPLAKISFVDKEQIEKLVVGSLPEVDYALPAPVALDVYHYAPNEIIGKLKAPLPPLRVFKIEKATARYDGDKLAVFDGQGRFFSPSSSMIMSPAEGAIYIPGNTALLVDEFRQDNYAHWLLDTLPRLLFIEQIVKEPIDNWVVGTINRPFHLQTLACFGIGPEQIVDLSKMPLIRTDNLFSLATYGWEAPHPARCGWRPALDYLRDKILGNFAIPPTLGKRRIFISRKDSGPRTVHGEDQLFERLAAEWGFERVRLSELALEDQARLFANAEIVIGAHGAGLANLLFCNPGTLVVEIFHPLCGTHAFSTISLALGLDYRYVSGEMLSATPAQREADTHQPHLSHQDYRIGEKCRAAILQCLEDSHFAPRSPIRSIDQSSLPRIESAPAIGHWMVNDIEVALPRQDIEKLIEVGKQLPPLGSYVEVGGSFKLSSYLISLGIAAQGLEGCRIFCVDRFNFDYHGEDPFVIFLDRLEKAAVDSHITPLRLDAERAISAFPDRSLDCLLIDADYHKELTPDDLASWVMKLRESGRMFFKADPSNHAVDRLLEDYSRMNSVSCSLLRSRDGTIAEILGFQNNARTR